MSPLGTFVCLSEKAKRHVLDRPSNQVRRLAPRPCQLALSYKHYEIIQHTHESLYLIRESLTTLVKLILGIRNACKGERFINKDVSALYRNIFRVLAFVQVGKPRKCILSIVVKLRYMMLSSLFQCKISVHLH